MGLLNDLAERSNNQCEICGSTHEVVSYLVPPKNEDVLENQVALCSTCLSQINGEQEIDKNQWRILNESIWSTVPGVQVLSFRMLHRLSEESWTEELLNMMYMEDETREWAENGLENANIIHKDCNGNILKNGDSVTLIQDLNVKGGGFTAKRGTAVRRISLVQDNAEHIEGKVNDQHIVILTKYVKKS